MTFNIRNRNQDSRNLCCSNQMLTFLSEFSSLIKKFIILLVPGMAKNTFCRLLGFSQTELRQPRKNSPAGVRLSTSKVGRMCSALLRAVSESPEGRCAWASLGLCPPGQVWAWEQPDRSLKHWAPWSGLLYCFHVLLPDVGVPFTSLPGSHFLKSTRWRSVSLKKPLSVVSSQRWGQGLTLNFGLFLLKDYPIISFKVSLLFMSNYKCDLNSKHRNTCRMWKSTS